MAGQRLQPIDLSGYNAGAANTARLKAQGGASLGEGIQQGAMAFVGTMLRRREQEMEKTRLDLARTDSGRRHDLALQQLSLDRENAQFRKDAAVLALLEGADERGSVSVDPSDPAAVEQETQSRAQRDTFRQVLTQRLSGGRMPAAASPRAPASLAASPQATEELPPPLHLRDIQSDRDLIDAITNGKHLENRARQLEEKADEALAWLVRNTKASPAARAAKVAEANAARSSAGDAAKHAAMEAAHVEVQGKNFLKGQAEADAAYRDYTAVADALDQVGIMPAVTLGAAKQQLEEYRKSRDAETTFERQSNMVSKREESSKRLKDYEAEIRRSRSKNEDPVMVNRAVLNALQVERRNLRDRASANSPTSQQEKVEAEAALDLLDNRISSLVDEIAGVVGDDWFGPAADERDRHLIPDFSKPPAASEKAQVVWSEADAKTAAKAEANGKSDEEKLRIFSRYKALIGKPK